MARTQEWNEYSLSLHAPLTIIGRGQNLSVNSWCSMWPHSTGPVASKPITMVRAKTLTPAALSMAPLMACAFSPVRADDVHSCAGDPLRNYLAQ